MKTRWQDWVMLALGAWLFFSPFWMAGYLSAGSIAAWNSYILGALVAIFAVVALSTEQRWEEWLQLAFGIWIVISPFVLGFIAIETGAAWNHFIVGVLIGADAIWALAVKGTAHHQEIRG